MKSMLFPPTASVDTGEVQAEMLGKPRSAGHLRFPRLLSVESHEVLEAYWTGHSQAGTQAAELRHLKMEVSSLFSIAGRVALVTGGSSGLGLMIAKVFSLSPRRSGIY